MRVLMTVDYIPRSRQNALRTIVQFSMKIYLVQGRTRRCWKTAVAVIAAFNLTGLAVDLIRFHSTWGPNPWPIEYIIYHGISFIPRPPPKKSCMENTRLVIVKLTENWTQRKTTRTSKYIP